MADLDVPMTDQMGKTIRNIAKSEEDKSIRERVKEVSIFYGIEIELGDFLMALGDCLRKDVTSFTKESIEAAQRIVPDDFSEEKVKERILQWKNHYDWDALRRLAIKVPVECENYAIYIMDLYNIIDGNLLNNHGVQVRDEASGLPVFLHPHRLRAARNLLVLLSNLMMACAYHKTRTGCYCY